MSKIFVLLPAFLLAACSNFTCQPHDEANAALPMIGRAVTVAPLSQVTDAVHAEADDDITVGSVPPQINATQGQSGKAVSEFVLERPRLFSATEDRKPWPTMHTLEWTKQEEEDARREKELSKVVQICRC